MSDLKNKLSRHFRNALADGVYGAVVAGIVCAPTLQRAAKLASGFLSVNPARTFRGALLLGDAKQVRRHLRKDSGLANIPFSRHAHDEKPRSPLEWAIHHDKDGSHASMLEALLPHSAIAFVEEALSCAQSRNVVHAVELLEARLALAPYSARKPSLKT